MLHSSEKHFLNNYESQSVSNVEPLQYLQHAMFTTQPQERRKKDEGLSQTGPSVLNIDSISHFLTVQQSTDGQTTPYISTLLHACKVLNNCAITGWSGPPDCGGLVHVHQGHLLRRTTAPAAANWRTGSHRRHRRDADREAKARQHNLWMFGGADLATKEFFMQLVPSATGQSSNPLSRHILPGSTIWSDHWGAYVGVNVLQQLYIHQTVNHDQMYVNPVTGCHTNNIKSRWNACKMSLK